MNVRVVVVRRKSPAPTPKPNLLDPKLLIQIGMILFAGIGFYFTTKARLDVIENNMTEIRSSLTDSRMVKVELKLEELEKDLGRMNMELMSLEDWINEELGHN
jgi:hypothetical protein